MGACVCELKCVIDVCVCAAEDGEPGIGRGEKEATDWYGG